MQLSYLVVASTLLLFSVHTNVNGFTVNTPFSPIGKDAQCYRPTRLSATADNDGDDKTKKMLEKAAQLRAEIAKLENKSVEEVTQEARDKKDAKEERRQLKQAASSLPAQAHPSDDGRFIAVPETVEEQIRQAARAVERAYADGMTRQTVRLALIKDGQPVSADVEAWPGGAKQMYNMAGKPLTEDLLKEVRAVPPSQRSDKSVDSFLPPTVTAQDIWDFDGSALITAEAAGGPGADVQALVFPNTDVKYLKDMNTIDQAMEDRLFLLVNPFWRDVESWGFNILAPNGKKMAQQTIFDKGYDETYVLQRFSARGERCVALKMYPYDWQLYAYRENDDYRLTGIPEVSIRLGSSKEEPRSAMFTELLNEREEFKYSRNMRQMMK